MRVKFYCRRQILTFTYAILGPICIDFIFIDIEVLLDVRRQLRIYPIF